MTGGLLCQNKITCQASDWILDFGGDNIVEYVTYQEFGRSEVLMEKSTMNLYLNSLICAKDAKSADFREC